MSILNKIFNLKSKQEKVLSLVQKICTKYRIDKKDIAQIENLITPTIGLETKSIIDENIQLGKSKIGGKPDLPKNFEWLLYYEKPMSFCAQYNCSDFTIYDINNKLPKQGIIYVFVYIDEEHPGFLNTANSYKVIYHETSENIIRTEFPTNFFNEGRFKSASIDYFEYYTMPDDENYKLSTFFNKYSTFQSIYDETKESIDLICGLDDPDNYHQIIGEDRSIQSSVVNDFAIRELKISTQEEFHSQKNKIEKLSRDFEIFIQLDTGDLNTNLSDFGGSSTMYFGLKKQNLKKFDLDKIVMEFQ